jgi:hypothetical protein
MTAPANPAPVDSGFLAVTGVGPGAQGGGSRGSRGSHTTLGAIPANDLPPDNHRHVATSLE